MKTKNQAIPLHLDLSVATSSQLLYEKIYLEIKQQIESGNLKNKDLLPSTRTLADCLHVSRSSVDHAYKLLRNEGYIKSVTGKGSEVCYQKVHLNDSDTSSFEPIQKEHSQTRQENIASSLVKSFRIQSQKPFSLTSIDFESRPGKNWESMAARLYKTVWVNHNYCDPAGTKSLQLAVSELLRKNRGLVCSPEQIIITNNIQQSLAFCARLLFNRDDKIGVPNPGYELHRATFEFHGLQTVPIRNDEIGNIEVANSKLAALLLTPSDQYPLGGVMSLAQRKFLLRQAKAQSFWILEDDCAFETSPLSLGIPAISALETNLSSCIYLGSFSKAIYPSLQVGYIVVPERLVDAFAGAKLMDDHHCIEAHQRLIANYILDGHYDKMQRRRIERNKDLWANAADQTERTLGQWGHLSCGLISDHLTFIFDTEIDDCLLVNYLLERGIETRALSSCYLENPMQGLLLGYRGFSKQSFNDSLLLLKQAIVDFLKTRI